MTSALRARAGRRGAGVAAGRNGSCRLGGPGLIGQLLDHWVIAAVVAGGLIFRVLVMVAYRPALELFGDSYSYLGPGITPDAAHPIGYPVLLRILSVTGSLAAVVGVQHGLTIVAAILGYLLLLRLGVRPWLAGLAAVPAMFDAYQVDVEHFVLSDSVFEFVAVATLVVLLWHDRPGVRAGATLGLLLSCAVLLRLSAAPLVAVVIGYMLLRRQWRAVAGLAAAFVVAGAAYAGFSYSTVGSFALQNGSGPYLYGRVAPFATCDYPVPGRLRSLCPTAPTADRPGGEFYVFDQRSPIHARGESGAAISRDAGQFARTVISHQPLDYLRAAATDTWHYFRPGHSVGPRDFPVDRIQFVTRHDPPDPVRHVQVADVGFDNHAIRPHADWGLASGLRSYQSAGYTPGLVLLACLVGGLAAGAGLLRGASHRQARWAALACAVTGLALVAMPSLTTGFDYRYGLPLLVTLPPAGAIAVDLLLGLHLRRGHGPAERAVKEAVGGQAGC